MRRLAIVTAAVLAIAACHSKKDYPPPDSSAVKADTPKVDTLRTPEPPPPAHPETTASVRTLERQEGIAGQPRYWPVTLEAAARGATSSHSHIEVRGQVVYTRSEDDGDLHIKLANAWNLAGPYVICECTLKEPCARPRVDADIIVRGLSRHDPEHGWWEIHPVDTWTYATAGE
jgi:hypothetical protein